MGTLLALLFSLQLFSTTTLSKIISTPHYATSSINDKFADYSIILPTEFSNEDVGYLSTDDAENDDKDVAISDIIDDIPLIKTVEDKTEMQFRKPIESVNVDNVHNSILLKFQKNNANLILNSLEKEKKKSLQDNFIRFGKRSYEEFPLSNSLDSDLFDKTPGMRLERSHQTARDARGDNFMRFGRSVDTKNDFMRFGRRANDFMRFGRSPGQDFIRFGRAAGADNFMRFGRSPNQDFMRFGRNPSQDFMRFGRSPNQDFMRFGRNPNQDFMRFGRDSGQNFMRFGRGDQDGFMRFGRNSHQDFIRFGRNSLKPQFANNFMRYSRPDNFMRFGRAPPLPSDNFIRFGKSLEKSNDTNDISQPMMNKDELKQAVKMIHEADKNSDNENPVDKAIKVLFDKHQQDHNEKNQLDELNGELNQHNGNENDMDSDLEYFMKMSK